LIGMIRRECLDQTLCRTTADPEAKLRDFQDYFNGYRTHTELGGQLPELKADSAPGKFVVIPMAEALSLSVSDADCSMIFGIRDTQVPVFAKTPSEATAKSVLTRI